MCAHVSIPHDTFFGFCMNGAGSQQKQLCKACIDCYVKSSAWENWAIVDFCGNLVPTGHFSNIPRKENTEGVIPCDKKNNWQNEPILFEMHKTYLETSVCCLGKPIFFTKTEQKIPKNSWRQCTQPKSF